MMRKTVIYPQKILIITHFFTTGPAVELRDFLKNKVDNLSYISHPFSFALGDKRSIYTIYKRDKKVEEKIFPLIVTNEILLYLKDFMVTLFFVLRFENNIDLCIASDNLNALAALVLKKFGKIKKVVYYNIDYTPVRFHNLFLNSIYHVIDRYCCYHADLNWNGTQKTNESRKKNGVVMQKMAPTIIVPDGNHALQIRKRAKKEHQLNSLVFVGHITKKQGLDLVIESLPELLKWNKKLRLIIIGTGEYEKKLYELAKRKKVENVIEWKGLIENHEEVEDILLTASIGFATYVPDSDSFTNFSEAGKPKLYLGCGLPVITTIVPVIAKEIEERKAGLIVEYTTKDFISAVRTILQSEKKYNIFQKNAQDFGIKFDWSIIFNKAFLNTL